MSQHHSHPHLNKPVSPSEMLAPLASWAGNLQRNTTDAFLKLNPSDYIRLVTIICGYLLIRPYLMKIGASIQQKEYNRKAGPADMGGHGGMAVDSSSRQTIQPSIPGVDSDSTDGERDGEEASWGRRARLRQRRIVREALARRERELQAMQQTESDKEIEDLLD